MNAQPFTETHPPADRHARRARPAPADIGQDGGAEWDELIEDAFAAFDPQTIGHLMQTPAFVTGLRRALQTPAA